MIHLLSWQRALLSMHERSPLPCARCCLPMKSPPSQERPRSSFDVSHEPSQRRAGCSCRTMPRNDGAGVPDGGGERAGEIDARGARFSFCLPHSVGWSMAMGHTQAHQAPAL